MIKWSIHGQEYTCIGDSNSDCQSVCCIISLTKRMYTCEKVPLYFYISTCEVVNSQYPSSLFGLSTGLAVATRQVRVFIDDTLVLHLLASALPLLLSKWRSFMDVILTSSYSYIFIPQHPSQQSPCPVPDTQQIPPRPSTFTAFFDTLFCCCYKDLSSPASVEF